MTLQTFRQYYLTCDRCESHYTNADIGIKSFMEEARKEGWSLGKRHLCPDCKKLNRNNKQS